jgi:hypothetical protein
MNRYPEKIDEEGYYSRADVINKCRNDETNQNTRNCGCILREERHGQLTNSHPDN